MRKVLIHIELSSMKTQNEFVNRESEMYAEFKKKAEEMKKFFEKCEKISNEFNKDLEVTK